MLKLVKYDWSYKKPKLSPACTVVKTEMSAKNPDPIKAKKVTTCQFSLCLLLLLLIFALNLDFTIRVCTVFAKFPTAIKTNRTPQNITCPRVSTIISLRQIYAKKYYWIHLLLFQSINWCTKWSKKANTNKLAPATQKQPQQLQSWATKVQHMPQIPEPR